MKPQDRRTMEGILFTDQYQLTMAQLYFRMGVHEKQVQFDHYYRNNPNYGAHQAGFCVNAGLEWLLDWMKASYFRDEDIDYLHGHKNNKGEPLFAEDFLAWLKKSGNFEGISLFAIPEGRVVHPNDPLTVVDGPMAMAQILETALLNTLNYQTLIATKAARMHESGRGRLLLEFGLRRAQDKGGNAGTRAALIGGADFSSNTGASHVLGFPPKGTHAHSLVQFFITMGQTELDAFRAYADVYPDECLLLVDTLNTLESGVPNAIKVFEELRRKGHEPVGIRLDSGDLAYLSIQAAKMLNAAGFDKTSIVLSNEVDELVIWQIITQIGQEAPRYGVDADQLINRLVYGVGTRLITSWGDPALGGVYKLVAVCDQDEWKPAIKISESPEKTPIPAHKQAWRIYDTRGNATADLLTLAEEDPHQLMQRQAQPRPEPATMGFRLRPAEPAPARSEGLVLHHPWDRNKYRILRPRDISRIEPLLVEVLREGELVYDLPSIDEMRKARQADIERLDPGVRRLVNPHIYHVSLSESLWQLKQDLIESAMEQIP